MNKNNAYSQDYQTRLAFAYAGGLPIARDEIPAREQGRADEELQPSPSTPERELPVVSVMAWEVKILTSSLVVKLWFLDPPNGLQSQVVALPVSVATQPLTKILEAVSRKAGVTVPLPKVST